MLEIKLIELCKDANDGQVATEYQSTTAHALKLSLSHLPQFTFDEQIMHIFISFRILIILVNKSLKFSCIHIRIIIENVSRNTITFVFVCYSSAELQ